MSLLIESIKLLDGTFYNLSHHEQRMNRSLKSLCGVHDHVDLEVLLSKVDVPTQGLFKCRIVYDDTSREIEFQPYQYKKIQSLRVVEHDRIHYEFKYTDRKLINRLYELRKDCDDILIVRRGFVTDSSYSNIVFRKNNHWVTPWSALLKGTQRQKLLDQNIIQEDDIRLEDIRTFQSFKLINAMFEFDGDEIDVSNIVF
ncbi:aminotransferase class IV [Ohtaekwangia kribbensis]|jgi:4-amino-4-deoxychorismate lyase|uniref:Aminotransferase class IV n=1 Tax=Ohtaekwangia kribbensis TaxID=688913 RepID=A0ABW3K672_9BACT